MADEIKITTRMQRFHVLLEKAKFGFKQYQYDGVKWCVNNECRKSSTHGGFIADEMGLGKTILMIGTMFINFLQRTLIILPPALIQQWQKEIFVCTGHKALMYYGLNKKNITLEILANAPIVLTTYNTILPKECLTKKIIWSRVIFDEAHHLRNSKTQRFKSCKQIRAPIRWLVTGTPIQNKRSDFYNLCNAAGMSKTFYTNPDNLKNIGQNFVLRRTKAQTGIKLPLMTLNDLIVPWKNIKEKMLSEEIHSLLPNQTFVSIEKRQKFAELLGKGGALVALLRAKQSCILPSLMMNNFQKLGINKEDYLEALQYNSKIDAVINLLLERKDNGSGKIVFCHYRDEIDIIATRLRQGGMSKVITYDGRNSGGHNLATLSDPADAIILQIQTGCEGLNLQHNFSEIYFVSPHWNPCVEDQAIARCHRIGQTKPVNVFKFEMHGFEKPKDSQIQPITLEKYVNSVQTLKRDISREILKHTHN